MLVLSRRKEESIVIDGQIEIEVLKVKGNTVRLGIKAPQNVKVLRGELSPFGIAGNTKPNDSVAGGLIAGQTFEVEHNLGGPLADRVARAQAG